MLRRASLGRSTINLGSNTVWYGLLISDSLSIRPSYGVRGEKISALSLFRFHLSPFPQKRLILRLHIRFYCSLFLLLLLRLDDVCDQLSVTVIGQKNCAMISQFWFFSTTPEATREICHKKMQGNTHGKFYNLSFEGTFWDVAQISKAQNFKNWRENIPWF